MKNHVSVKFHFFTSTQVNNVPVPITCKQLSLGCDSLSFIKHEPSYQKAQLFQPSLYLNKFGSCPIYSL